MKWVFITGIVGLLALVAVGYGGWYWFHQGQVDTTKAGFVDTYKQSFTSSCASAAENSAIKAGREVDEAMRTRIQKICTCGAEASVEEFKSKEHMSMSDMLNDPMLQQKLPGIMQACVQKFGAQ